jgi:hypothetical protein
MNSDPAVQARRLEGIRAYYDDPENRAKAREKVRKLTARVMANPEMVERKREHGRRTYRDVLSRPDVREKNLSPEVRAKAGRARSDTVLAWCPPEYRDLYRQLWRSRNVSAVEARRMVEEQIAKDNSPLRILDRFYGGKPAKAA